MTKRMVWIWAFRFGMLFGLLGIVGALALTGLVLKVGTMLLAFGVFVSCSKGLECCKENRSRGKKTL